MNVERLDEVFDTKLEELSSYEVTSEAFGEGVQSLDRLAQIKFDYEKSIMERDKLDLTVDESEIKRELEKERFENQKINDELARKADFRKDLGVWITAGVGITVDIVLHFVGFVFEEEGTVRSQAFRNYYLKHFVKKR